MKRNPISHKLFTTKQERNGTLVILFILLLAIATNRILPILFEPSVEFSEDQLAQIAAIDSQLSFRNANQLDEKLISNKNYSVPEKIKEVIAQEFEVIELNSVDTAGLEALYGIGHKTASSILKYRSLLGGYSNPEQLFEVYRIDSVTVMSLLPRFRANSSLIQKMNINQLGLYDLKRHPYISIELARVIIESRYKEGNFENLQELEGRGLVNAEYYSKIAPYLSCE